MNKTICKIDLKLPSLNEYINACRINRFKGAKMKKDFECAIGLFIEELPVFSNPVIIDFTWVEENKRRDLDNVAFAKKFILDALVKYGKLKDDNRKIVTGFSDKFVYGEKACVILEIYNTFADNKNKKEKLYNDLYEKLILAKTKEERMSILSTASWIDYELLAVYMLQMMGVDI